MDHSGAAEHMGDIWLFFKPNRERSNVALGVLNEMPLTFRFPLVGFSEHVSRCVGL